MLVSNSAVPYPRVPSIVVRILRRIPLFLSVGSFSFYWKSTRKRQVKESLAMVVYHYILLPLLLVQEVLNQMMMELLQRYLPPAFHSPVYHPHFLLLLRILPASWAPDLVPLPTRIDQYPNRPLIQYTQTCQTYSQKSIGLEIKPTIKPQLPPVEVEETIIVEVLP